MAESIYNKLENRIGEMNTLSPEETTDEISPEAKKYLDGFGDKVFDVKKLAEGIDSTVVLAKIRGFENRTQLIKIYDGIGRMLRNKKDTIPVLKKYFEICSDVREYLREDKNPLLEEISIDQKKYSPEFSVAPTGILVEKNGEVGSWIREWIPGDNFDYFQAGGAQGRHEILMYVKKTCDYLTGKFGYPMDPGVINYKVVFNENSHTINIVFTDITDFIPRMVKEAPFKKVYH